MTQLSLFQARPQEGKAYLNDELITCLGNKRALLHIFEKGLSSTGLDLQDRKIRFIDLFSGSGVVSRFMKRYSALVHSNDLERYSCFVNDAYLTNRSEIDEGLIRREWKMLQEWIQDHWQSGFIAEMYAPADDAAIRKGERVFYTRRNAQYIDTASMALRSLPLQYGYLFKANLIVKASIHNNTGGVFKGFYKDRDGIGAFGGAGRNALKRILGEIHVEIPTLSVYESRKVVTCSDALGLMDGIEEEYDIAYVDPPYNQHPYGSNYFMLNLIESYERPSSFSRVSGIPDNWNRSPYNSPKTVRGDLFSVIERVPARYVLISYNSEGFIQYEEFMDELSKYREVTIVDAQYNTYKASRNLSNRDTYVTEYLFVVKK